ncbi:MAG: M23 family metallopeptidase [Bacteroidota bacterium]
MRYVLFLLILTPITCGSPQEEKENNSSEAPFVPVTDLASWNAYDAAFSMADLPWVKPVSFQNEWDSLFFEHPGFLSDGFDYPLGAPNGKGYYVAQGFGINRHLGEDWNAVTGGNSDLGDTIYAISHGYIRFAEDPGGRWGNTIRMVHKVDEGTYVESLYAHCDEMLVVKGQWISRGEPIGTVGTANGAFLAHLHLELRDSLNMGMRSGYSRRKVGYRSPREFIQSFRAR